MDAAKLPPAFDALIKTDLASPDLTKTDQALPVGRSNATEPGHDIVAAGAISIAKIEKLMEELRTARDYLRSEGERVKQINARFAHLTSTASASVEIITESLGKWRTTEIEAASDTEPTMRRTQMSPLRSVYEAKTSSMS